MKYLNSSWFNKARITGNTLRVIRIFDILNTNKEVGILKSQKKNGLG